MAVLPPVSKWVELNTVMGGGAGDSRAAVPVAKEMGGGATDKR